ncbi:MAG: dihydrodipicolinate synthase family protein, partial [Lysobacteraceae bacterium]
MRLSGSITALATPFTRDGSLDLDAWTRVLEKQIAAGTSAVVVAGSTGEANALDDAEYDRLLSSAVAVLRGRIGVLAGTGLPNTAKTIALTRRAAALCSDSGREVSPAYVRPAPEGRVAHCREVDAGGGLPV